jgi:hypothetical protein
MSHIKFRIWKPGVSNEIPLPGEPFADPDNSRIGMYFSGAPSNISWLPRFSNSYVRLNQSQLLNGIDSGNVSNPVVLDWAENGVLKIRNTLTNKVYARFEEASQTFDNVLSVQTGLPGLVNSLINSGLSVSKGVNTDVGAINTLSVFNRLIAPNWMVWRKTTLSAGSFAATLSTDVPAGIGATRSLKVDAVGAPSSQGVRMFFFGPDMYAGQNMTLTVYHKGTLVGSQAKIRVETQSGGINHTATISYAASWTRFTTTFTMPANPGKWLAVDVPFEPNFNTMDAGTWYFAAPQLSPSYLAGKYEARDAAIEKTLLRTMYSEGRHYFQANVPVRYQADLLNVGITPRHFFATDSAAPLTVSDLSPIGAEFLLGSIYTPTRASCALWLAPSTSETG